MGQEPNDRGRQKRYQQIDEKPAISTLTSCGSYGPRKSRPIEPEYCQNSAKLDEDVERLGTFVHQAEPVAHNNKVAGGRDRNKLCGSFYQTEYGTLQQKLRRHKAASSEHFSIE